MSTPLVAGMSMRASIPLRLMAHTVIPERLNHSRGKPSESTSRDSLPASRMRRARRWASIRSRNTFGHGVGSCVAPTLAPIEVSHRLVALCSCRGANLLRSVVTRFIGSKATSTVSLSWDSLGWRLARQRGRRPSRYKTAEDAILRPAGAISIGLPGSQKGGPTRPITMCQTYAFGVRT